MKKALFIFLFILSSLSVFGSSALASNVYVKPVVDRSLQIGDSDGYIHYDVKNLGGQTIESSFIVQNNSNEQLIILPSIRNGLTGEDKEVYQTQQENGLSGFVDPEYMMENYILGLPEKIELEPNQAKEIHFQIQVPKNLQGQLVGGIGFTEYIDKTDNTTEAAIDINRGFVFAVWLEAMSLPSTGPSENELTFGELELNIKGKTAILMPILNNETPYFIKNYEVTYEVTKRNKSDEVIFKGVKTINTIAPKNYFKLPIPWEGELKDGKYTLTVNEESFDFDISRSEAKDIEERSNTDKEVVETIPDWIWYLISGLVGIILIMIFIFLLKRKKNEEDTEETSDNDKVKES